MKNKLVTSKKLLLSTAIAFAAFGAQTTLAAPIKPCTSATVAFVKSIKGDPSNVMIARAGQEAPLTPFSPLCKGDVLTLKTASETVILGVAGNPGPNEVAGPVKYTVGPANTGAESVSEVLQDRLMPLGNRTIGQGLGRSGEPFEFGLLDLETESARIKSGTRPLWIGWNGGQSPFELSIIGPTGPVANKHVEGNAVTLPASDYAVGRYNVSVKDANGRRRVTTFEAVSETPAGPDVEVPSWMGADAGVMLSAFCVAAEDPYTWSFEAAQQIESAPDAGIDRQSALALISSGDTETLCPGKNG